MWKMLRVDEDLESEKTPRWLMVFEVPQEYAPDGVYSVSIPKGLVNDWAAVFEYDMARQDHVDDLLDYLVYFAYINEALRREGRADEVLSDPLALDPGQARSMIKGQLSEFKAERPIVQEADLNRTMSATVSAGPLDVLKSAMRERIDHDLIGKNQQMMSAYRKGLER
ncbi:hypothetical protein Aph01nite_43890 [Acrocarpospora phusangensis]|uniref:Uncharacterized protein n=1 Tax=Acrocarpospora phusangensis TaxID=1070424 RepID=A0A919QE55_9ACTN|nr:hypothetical protein [Acrocarpospora phusangensis]GIH26079.1 hypothetical protein Aph01nite_43890 [Acrocarpospora phusangensis]